MGTAGSFSRVYIAETGAGLDGSGREKPALRESRSPKKVQKYFISIRPGALG